MEPSAQETEIHPKTTDEIKTQFENIIRSARDMENFQNGNDKTSARKMT